MGRKTNAVSIGTLAGKTNQGTNAVSLGKAAGRTSQGTNAVAIGHNLNQGIQTGGDIGDLFAVAIGT